MRVWNITSTVALAACGLVLVLLAAGSALLIRYQVDVVEDYNREHRDKLGVMLENRAAEEKAALRDNVRFNAEILAGTVAIHLYNYDETEMRKALRLFLDYPEVLAVEVLEETGAAFAAVWKQGDVPHNGKALPAGEDFAAHLQSEVSLLRNETELGMLRVYYSSAPLTARIEALKQRAMAESERFYAHSQARLEQTVIRQIAGIALITLALVISLMLLLRYLVHKPLVLLSNVADHLVRFDLTKRLPRRRADEVGRLFAALDSMVSAFRAALENAQHTAVQVSSSAAELSAASRQQEAVLSNQIASIRQVGQTVAEISRDSRELAATVQNSTGTAHETAEFANQGKTGLVRMENAIRNMEQASKLVSQRLQIIHEKADNITAVVTTITKVAEQTNLLSLNAAIEAEKAGEYGRGFTVVAREIRRLADQTAVATLDIEHMVTEMQGAVSSGVMEIGKFVDEVRDSAGEAAQTSEHLNRIIEKVHTLTPDFEHIEQAVLRQSRHAGEIDQALDNFNEEMEQTGIGIHESFTAIAQINQAAHNLRQVLAQFKV